MYVQYNYNVIIVDYLYVILMEVVLEYVKIFE